MNLESIADILEAGGIVGIPTETVYGLAARIDKDGGIRRIFATKERPFFDPLIVHVSSVEQAKQLVTVWPKAAGALTTAFWPGPLTLVLPKQNHVSSLITSGLDTVALRMPRHNETLELIGMIGVPLAAPSANRFGRTSPTTAEHVRSEFGPTVPVLDGGPCTVGIESTVLALGEENGISVIEMLRPGSVTIDQIIHVLETLEIPVRIGVSKMRSVSPGQLDHHYMPDIPLFWVQSGSREFSAVLKAANELRKGEVPLKKAALLTLSADPTVAARELYANLRTQASSGADSLIFFHEPHQAGPAWDAILDRLKRASTLTLPKPLNRTPSEL